jgi:hypothetical protein
MNDQHNQFDFAKFESAPEIVKKGKISEFLIGKPKILVQILIVMRSLHRSLMF